MNVPRSRVTEVLGGVVRALMQHSNNTAASIDAAMALVVPPSAHGSTAAVMTCPEALAVVFTVRGVCCVG